MATSKKTTTKSKTTTKKATKKRAARKKKPAGTGRNGRRAVIVAGVRTPFVRAFGHYTKLDTIDLSVAATGALLGARETRRIIGDYVVTIDDYLARRDFPDEICRNAYNIDVHSSKDADAARADPAPFPPVDDKP